MNQLYNVYHVNLFLGDQMKVGTMFNGEIIVNLFRDKFDSIHGVPHDHLVVVTRTRGMDMI